jgi:hypothetical protein
MEEEERVEADVVVVEEAEEAQCNPRAVPSLHQ